MSRFFVKDAEVQSGTIIISGDDVNHIKNVLRLQPGENITINDCAGNDFLVRIDRYGAGLIYTSVLTAMKNETEPPIEVVLFQGIPKSDKMDFIIQKSIELGAVKIVPVITEHTVVRFDYKKDAEKKTARWQKISTEAAKQCNRGTIPQVQLPIKFSEALSISEEFDLSIIPYEKEREKSLRQYIRDKSATKIALFIGPEGGFSEKEIESAISKGVKPVTLGPRILRTETAGITVMSILMYELGDVG